MAMRHEMSFTVGVEEGAVGTICNSNGSWLMTPDCSFMHHAIRETFLKTRGYRYHLPHHLRSAS